MLLSIPPLYILLLRLGLVILIGGLIGMERELKSKSAGFRTIMLISIGSFLFTTFSIYLSPSTPDRIASNIVTGIGFLGAGVIFKGDNRVNGLTTAATIWVTAALGMGVASGLYLFVIIATVIVFASLFLLMRLELLIDQISVYKTYTVKFHYRDQVVQEYERLIKHHHLHGRLVSQSKEGIFLTVSWVLKGRAKDHEQFTHALFHDEYILKFEV